MQFLWDFLVTFIKAAPWIVIALVAAWIWYKRQSAKILLLQAVSAAGMFTVTIGQWLTLRLLTWMNVGTTIWSAAVTIFSFLLFMFLATFAAAFCIERFYNRKTITVTATPVDK